MRLQGVKTLAKYVPVDTFIYMRKTKTFFFVDDMVHEENMVTFIFEEDIFKEKSFSVKDTDEVVIVSQYNVEEEELLEEIKQKMMLE